MSRLIHFHIWSPLFVLMDRREFTSITIDLFFLKYDFYSTLIFQKSERGDKVHIRKEVEKSQPLFEC